MPTTVRPVFETLRHSPARLVRSSLLDADLHAAMWHRQDLGNTVYHHPGHHTLSFYLDGGFDICRRNQPDLRGAPGKFCILPAQHESDWLVGGESRFLHLYFSQTLFDEFAIHLFDCEPRGRELLERTYIDDPYMAQLCRQLITLDWTVQDGMLSAHAIAHETLAHLMLTQTGRLRHVAVKGGLASQQRRRVLELIEAELDGPLTVAALATELGLSQYHFARMFKTSLGVAPHTWICRRRLLRARTALSASNLSLADIAAACGFSSASHLANRFRSAHGVTAGQYRHWAKGG